MKPGMQRDLLVAYWLLFDEFDIGGNDPPRQADSADRMTPTAAASEPEKPKRNNGGKTRRRT